MKTQSRIHRRLKGNERLNYHEWCERYRDTSDPLNRGLVFALPMFEGSGTASVLDCARPHHPVTQTHAPSWTQLASGHWCMGFDGASDYLTSLAANTSDMDFTTGEFSMSIWHYAHSVDTKALISRGTAALKTGWNWEYVGNALRFYTSGVDFAEGGARTANVWQLVSLSRTGATTMAMYRNGADETSDSSIGNITSSVGNFCIGVHPELIFPFDGLLALPRIWNRALSASEHKELFERSRGLFGV